MNLTSTPPNFGTDTSCTTSLQTGRLVSGVRLVGEAAYRRLTTPLGMLLGGDDEADYGLDLAGMLGSSISTPSLAASMPAQIQNELLKDQRIDSVTATVIATTTGPSTSWLITVNAVTALGPFTLVLAVSEVTTTLLGLTT